jgi:hypothetical protein
MVCLPHSVVVFCNASYGGRSHQQRIADITSFQSPFPIHPVLFPRWLGEALSSCPKYLEQQPLHYSSPHTAWTCIHKPEMARTQVAVGNGVKSLPYLKPEEHRTNSIYYVSASSATLRSSSSQLLEDLRTSPVSR